MENDETKSAETMNGQNNSIQTANNAARGENSAALAAVAVSPAGTYLSVLHGEKHSLLSKRIFKAVIILIMLVLLQLPLLMVSCQVESREKRLQEVADEIAVNWGAAQTIECQGGVISELNADCNIETEIRHRGIFEVPVYTATVKIDAVYANVSDGISIHIYDIKAVQQMDATVDGKKVECKIEDGRILVPSPKGTAADLKITIVMRGMESLQIHAPAGKNMIKIHGDWADPGFGGTVLPGKRTIEDDCFAAEWNISNFGQFTTQPVAQVNFCIAAGSYQQVARTLNYGSFFLIIFFFTLFVSEIFAKHEIHPVQYIVASGGPVLFYLMLLAISEHTDFLTAYVISTAVVVLMMISYAIMFMGKWKSALIMGAMFAASYAGNCFILQMEDWALLAGTIVLTVILGVLMLLTGKINRQTDGEIAQK